MSSHRRTLAAGLATAAASVSLYPIFTGGLWFLVGLGSIAVVAATGTATRVRRLPELVCLLSGLVALLLYLNLAFSSARSFLHVLPTLASIRQLFDVAGQGFNEASRYAPPVPELRGMLLLTAAGVGIAALLTDWIAVRLGSAALAGLPLLLLFVEPFTLSVGRGFLGTTVAFGVGVGGYLALLSSEGKDRIREWEHQDPSARDAPDTRPLAAAGRRVGFASVVLALFLPLVIPGLHVTRLFGGQPGIGGRPGSGSGSGGADVGFPGVDTVLSQQLNQELNSSPANVLTYTTTESSPDYLQIYVLDRLTDSGWQLFSQSESKAHVDPGMPAPPGLTKTTWAANENTRITISGDVGADDLGALPVPYPAVTVQAKGDLEADRSTLMLFDPDTALAGLQYSVISLSDAPPPQALNDAAAAPAAITGSYLRVPASYDSLRGQAESVVARAGAKTSFEKAVALQNWLSDGTFKYTLKAPTVLSASGLTTFLEKTKSGYCQQFSFAMAVLARLLGIPSRVAYGFTAGTPAGKNDQWVVTTHDAHAWPELYFEGFGWLRFEPTPSGSTGQGTAYAPSYTYLPGSTAPGGATNREPTSAPTAPASGQGSQSGLSPNLRNALSDGNLGNNTDDTPGTGARTPGVNPWEVFGLVVAGLAVVGLAAPWTARLVIRRRRWRRGGYRGGHGRRGGQRGGPAGADIEWAHAAWRELRDDLVDYGAGGLPSESPRAVATRAGTELALAEPARAALGRIAMAEERARYSARPADGTGLRQDSTTVRRAIAVAAPRVTRWRGRLLPASVTGPALNAMAQAADIFGRLTPDWLGRFRPPTNPLQAAFLSPAPALIEPLHHRGAGGLATAAPAAVTRAARAALADRTARRRPAKGDGGHLPPAAQRPDAGQQQDDEPADRQADEVRQHNPGRDHRRAENQPNERRYHPTPVVHVGIAGAN